MDTAFQRARSDEQRAIRRQTILDTAAAMLEEMPVGDVSLNELSRRVGLAKSNVLRYFDSREAVLLELLDALLDEWLRHLARELPAAVNPKARYERRAERLASALAKSLAERPVLCDLLSAQAAVLEHNVSVEAITSFKQRGMANAKALTQLVNDALLELTEDQAWRLVLGVLLMTSALWSYATPPQAVLDAYEQHEDLRAMRLEFSAALEDHVITLAIGLHARAGARRAVRA
jgi:AcrR family transcriptional regulator